ncbi:MAG: TerD family protein [Candidatus Sericytochromatia bacterium]|nr:TerD family protein [Candidatus Sericytochromatia bacterium]
MSITLSKGQKISLEKEAPGLKKIILGLGWDIKSGDSGFDFDLDASCFMIGANEKIVSDYHFIFYNNLKSPDGSVEHTGDNLTGSGNGDDEQIKIDFSKISSEVKKLVFVVTIHDAQKRKQSFGQVSHSFIRLVNEETGKEIAKYDLGEDYSTETAMIMAEVYLHNGEWRMSAVGTGYNQGLEAIVKRYYDGEIN